jgi:peptidoglycan/xylan/chitin deacetylase (PgdA/CDA1 family)
MRLDRLLTLYLFRPLNRLRRPKSDVSIPILMYHSISDREVEASHPYFQTNTKLEVFARQMQFLADNNYKVISLSEAISLLSNSPITQLPNQPVTPSKYCVLTWDDGYLDFYANAFPILEKLGFTASVFLPTGFIADHRRTFKGRDCLKWEEIRSLSSRGIDFGSHTIGHHQLYLEERGKLESELKNSKEAIEHNTKQQVDAFSYPFAFPDQDVQFVSFLKDTLQTLGYKFGVTTRIGTASNADDLYFLKRLPINNEDDTSMFAAKLEGSYDWLYEPQRLYKKLKALSA